MGLEWNWNEIPKIQVFLVRDGIKLFQLEFLGIPIGNVGGKDLSWWEF
jgi:hypothetical protein